MSLAIFSHNCGKNANLYNSLKSPTFMSLLSTLIFFCSFQVCFSVPNNNVADDTPRELLFWREFSVKYKDRSILNMTKPGSVFSGRVLGVLGPSGSGKTTFLNALSEGLASTRELTFSGGIMASNGKSLSKDEVAFIYQDDSFFSQLSVRETLQLASSLRLFNNTSQAVIDNTINYLALDKIADNYVGDIISRGISGGERKRLAVGCEMLGTAPALLIADEPSSGLDSFQATQVIKLLKKIAVEKGIAVVCSIHQPRSSIWNIFDDILLLGPGGHVVYHGPRNQALAYFKNIGYDCPADTNPAEFLIDLISIDNSEKEQSEKRVRTLADMFSAMSSEVQAVSEDRPLPNRELVITAPSHRISIWRTSRRSLYRLGLLLQRALRQTLRDKATNLVRIGTSALLATIIGTIYGKSGGPGPLTSTGISDKVTLIAHASINVGMLSMIKALQLFKRERAVVDRERAQGRYSALEYLLAKLAAELPLDAAIGATFGYIVHSRGRLQSNNHVFAGLLALVSCVTSSLGLAIGAIFPTGDVALSIGPALMVVYVILGAVGPAGAGAELPLLLKPFQKASPIRWACEALCAAELRGRELTNKKSTAVSMPLKHRSDLRLLSLGGVGKLFRRALLFVGSQLLSLGDVLFKVGTEGPRKADTVKSGGDRTLALLHIPDATIAQSSSVLGKMLAMHILLAWVGLLVGKSKRS